MPPIEEQFTISAALSDRLAELGLETVPDPAEIYVDQAVKLLVAGES
jgi:hypothetical protein